MNTFRPLVKKQMHTFNVQGTILGGQEVVHIIYSFKMLNKLEYTK